ncbi:MAG TPA: hypothetical protein VEL07_16460 [Planctomycetota bacterium]|nr:hypothetical protein [Planctomycetota bacterium]
MPLDAWRRRAAVAALASAASPEHGLAVAGEAEVRGGVRRQPVTWAALSGLRRGLIARPAGGGAWPAVLVVAPHQAQAVAAAVGLARHGLVVLAETCVGDLAADVADLLNAVAAVMDHDRAAGLTIGAVGIDLGAESVAWLALADQRVGAVWLHAPRVGCAIPEELATLDVTLDEVVASLPPCAVGLSAGSAGPAVHAIEVLDAALDPAREAGATNCDAHLGAYGDELPDEVVAMAAARLDTWLAGRG